MSKKDDCCNTQVDLSKVNPHVYTVGKSSRRKSLQFFEIENPLPKQIVDSEEVSKMFQELPLIPYAGYNTSTAHALLQCLEDYRFLSPTHGACIESIKNYAFGGKIDIVQSIDYDFDFGDEAAPITSDKKREFVNTLRKIDLDGKSWKDLACNLSESFDTNGNFFIEIVKAETAGQKYAKISQHPATKCVYKATAPGKQKEIAISAKWTQQYIKEHPPRLVPVFPTFYEYGDGSMRSIIHVKNGNFEWYGRPQSFGSFIDQYNEYQNRLYLSKQVSKGFVGNVLMEFEEEGSAHPLLDGQAAKEKGFDSALDRIEQNWTNKGDDPSSVIALSRPKGSRPAFVHQFTPNLNADFFQKSGQEHRANIIMTHDWSEKLLRTDGANGFSTNMFLDIFKIKSGTKILNRQNTIAKAINTAIQDILHFFEVTEFEEYAIAFKSPLQNLIEQAVDE